MTLLEKNNKKPFRLIRQILALKRLFAHKHMPHNEKNHAVRKQAIANTFFYGSRLNGSGGSLG